MGRKAKEGWELKALEDFQNGIFNRFYQEKLVSLGLMRRYSVPKKVPGRGPNPVVYEITEAGKAFMGGDEPIKEVIRHKSVPSSSLPVSPEIFKANSEFQNLCQKPNWKAPEIKAIRSKNVPDKMIPNCVRILYPKKTAQIKVLNATVDVQEWIEKNGSW